MKVFSRLLGICLACTCINMTIVAMEREAIHEFKRMDRPERAQEALDTQRIREEAQKPKACSGQVKVDTKFIRIF